MAIRCSLPVLVVVVLAALVNAIAVYGAQLDAVLQADILPFWEYNARE